ncbi:hypothetical protein GLOTRDRAFT_139339 [Gloeophyllum trabeum ATCC 11539]|uniref:Protein ROT1 n=1 Tax=Gloeophyllum trabeum (strain ATCC 11539 / FP-39264 / Madison 617) TaxID=670483 RepID=S7Q5X6_GLOTA|nr:uncharacterized protein GLOTRDRAFT_139339 [Gloeophyllum trabeum ATCC 11539]EPQ54877.1 hypothetical protein GLOTRDRAFT_139339 [Gloeophyllum trabeum ATCC 11539]
MLFSALISLLAVAAPALAQDSFVGTWSSGSGAVVTGSGFANPGNLSFTYPKNTGISYSFTSDGFYEIARYRFSSNASQPNCITGVMNWVHGTYETQPNGSVVLTPFGDGYQQIQNPCGAVSNFIENYNDTELLSAWAVYAETTGQRLYLYSYDGSPLAPQNLVSTTPNMLPTQRLRNVTGQVASSSGSSNGLNTQNALAVSGSERRWSVESAGLVGTVLAGAGVASLFL